MAINCYYINNNSWLVNNCMVIPVHDAYFALTLPKQIRNYFN